MPAPWECPEGERWDEDAYACVPSGSGTGGQCNTGFEFCAEKNQCVPIGTCGGGDQPPICPDGKPARRRGGDASTGGGENDWVCFPEGNRNSGLPELPTIPQTGNARPGSFNFSSLLNPNRDVLSLYSQRSPEEIAFFQAMTDIARLQLGAGANMYAVGFPAYYQAVKYWGSLLGGDKAAATRAVAPQGEQMADVWAGQRRGIESGPLRGGAKDQALAESSRQQAGQIASLLPQAISEAAQMSGSLGLAGTTQGMSGMAASAGTYGGLLSNETQNRQFAIGAEQANRFGGASLLLQDKSLDLQSLLGMRSLDIQEMLGLGSLDLQRAGLAQNQSQFDASQAFAQQYFDWNKLFQQQQQQAQQRTQKGQMFGSIFSALITATPAAVTAL